jgi:hypothetical protein
MESYYHIINKENKLVLKLPFNPLVRISTKENVVIMSEADFRKYAIANKIKMK